MLQAGDGVDAGLAERTVYNSKFHEVKILSLEDFVEKNTPFFS